MADEYTSTHTSEFQFQFSVKAIIFPIAFLIMARFDIPLALALIASVMFHELGHILAATALGVRVKAIGANGLGCFIRREQSLVPLHEAAIAFAGPLANIVLALILPAPLSQFNWLMVIFNLAPIPSSDGMRVLRSLHKSA